MNIWLINPFSDLPNEGAAEGRFCCLARMLAEQGHTVTWWTVDFHHRKKAKRSEAIAVGGEESRTSNDEAGGRCEIVLLPVPSYQKNISLARLKSHRAYGREFLKMAQLRIQTDPSSAPAVIHMSVPPLDCIGPALALKKQLGCRVTVDVMDLWPETFTRLIPGGEQVRSVLGRLIFAPMFRWAQRAYREADGVSAVSQEYLDIVKQVAPEQDTHLCYVGGGLIQPGKLVSDDALFTANSNTSAENDQRLVTFIYVGAMSPTYDLDTVIDAAQILKAEGKQFQVRFAGTGVSESTLQQRVKERGLENTVIFLGFLNQEALEDALVSSDVGLNTIMPGTFITMPHKLSDYLCAGLAVINSTEGEADALLQSQHSGRFYPAKDVGALVDAMRTYIQSPQTLGDEKANARQLAAKSFDRSKTYLDMAKWLAHES